MTFSQKYIGELSLKEFILNLNLIEESVITGRFILFLLLLREEYLLLLKSYQVLL